MMISKRIGAVMAGGVVLLALAARAAAPGDDIAVTCSRMNSAGREFNRGYAAAHIEVKNLSATAAHAIELRAGGYRDIHLTRYLKLAPGATEHVRWSAPMLSYDGTITVFVDGQRKGMNPLPLECVQSYFGGGAIKPCVLVSRRVAFDPFNNTLNAPPTMATKKGKRPVPAPGSSSDRVNLLRAELEVGGWFNDWRDYSGYDGIVLAADEWGGLAPDAQEALTRYVECGGAVYFFGTAPCPAGWAQAGVVHRNQMNFRPVGFGRWVELPVARAEALTEAQADRLVDLMERNQCTNGDLADKLEKFTVVPNISVPVGGVSLCILLFVALAGPVNLVFLIRRRRRIWLLWTTPLLGLLFAGVLVAYFLASEGLTRRARLKGLTLLNEQTQRATTLAVEGVYCPIPPADGLRYGVDWELTWDPRADRAGGQRALDLTSGQHFRAGWISARVPFCLALRGSRHAAERLPVTVAADGSVSAVNGLGATLKTLTVRTPDGQWYGALNVKPGAQAQLAARVQKVTHGNDKLAGHYRLGAWADENARLDADLLQPGQYLAELDRAVFVQQGLERADYRETQFVLGISAAATPPKGGTP